MKKVKKILSIVLVAGVVVSQIFSASSTSKAASVRLNKSSLSLRAGSSYRLKVTGTKKKIKWSSSKKSVATVSTSGYVSAKKAGSAKIYASVSGKKLTCKVTVRSGSTEGTATNPLSAYGEHTITYYEGDKKIGSFRITLNEFLSGEEAYAKVVNNSTNPVPTNTQEYIYFAFTIKYVSGEDLVNCKDLFNYYKNIYDSTGKEKIENIDWGLYFELMEDLGDVRLSPGNTTKCSKAILITKGKTPVRYRIKTGAGSNSYTWFTTE